MKVWLDDVREMPEGYDIHARTASEAISLLRAGQVTLISLDHDLGPDESGTGYDVAVFIEKGAFEGTLSEVEIRIHSANPVGRARMEVAIANAERYWRLSN